MEWRNEQMFHLRQKDLLTLNRQDEYFQKVIAPLFDSIQPKQLLFSFLKDGVFIGYGGLVHLDWVNQNAEISFLLSTEIQNSDVAQEAWLVYLELIQNIAFGKVKLNRIYTYAFDLRPWLYPIFESVGFTKDAVLREHVKLDEEYVDVVIHSKLKSDS